MIARNRIIVFLSQQPKAGKYLLPMSWLSGMLLGFSFAFLAGRTHLHVFHDTLCAQTSFVSIFLVSFFPFLLCKISTHTEQRWLIYLTCFLKSALFAYCAMAIGFACGSSAWLIRLLLLFTDSCTIPVFYYYCSCLTRSDGCIDRWLHYGVFIYAFMIPLIDHCFISPFLFSVLLC